VFSTTISDRALIQADRSIEGILWDRHRDTLAVFVSTIINAISPVLYRSTDRLSARLSNPWDLENALI
jgi:hypothetical protein